MTRTANGIPLPLPDDVLTSDGGIVTIRPTRADDLRKLAALGAGIARLRPDPQAPDGLLLDELTRRARDRGITRLVTGV